MGGSMSAIVLSGDTSGAVTINVPAVAGTNTVTIPAVTGTAVVSGQNSAITAGTAVASTSGTSIDFTSIPSWVKRITIMLSSVSFNGSGHLLIQIGTSGGIVTSGYNSTSTYALAGSSATGGVTSTNGYIMYVASSAYLVSGHIVLTNISSNIWICSGMIGNLSSITYTGQTGGAGSLSGSLSTVRLTSSTGTDTFDNGQINILYE